MLIATPYRDFDVRDRSPPKVISEVRKSYLNSLTPSLKPKLTGELLIKCGSDKTWYPRKVQVRGGQLHVFTAPGELGPPSSRLPLRHLSLQAGPLSHSLAICRGQNIVITLQTANERFFDEWVRTIAIELIRQTPLDAIKYLDILTLAECWTRRDNNYEKDWNFNNLPTPNKKPNPCDSCTKNEKNKTPKPPQREPLLVFSKSNSTGTTKKPVSENCAKTREKTLQPSPPMVSPRTEDVVENLLKKCQNVETYVPVKDKLFLFESLCKMDRKVRSTEDVSLKIETSATKRARSLHDLSNINSHIAVREICKYFENRGDDEGEDRGIVLSKKLIGGSNFRDSCKKGVQKTMPS